MNRKKIDVAFIILHWMEKDLTIRGVESALKLSDISNSRIIIVDNASPNGSGKELQEFYKDNELVDVVLSERNGGFSEGNNLGYKYCIENYDADFVIAANNDIIFTQTDFIPVLKDLYNHESFYIAGPDIFQPYDYIHQNPMWPKKRTLEEHSKRLEEWTEKLSRYEHKFSVRTFLRWCMERHRESAWMQLLRKITIKILFHDDGFWQEQHEDLILQGSCIIFSKDYIKSNQFLFEPLTFMYFEEDFLYMRCSNNGWKILYSPKLKVVHTTQGSLKLNEDSYEVFKKKKVAELCALIELSPVYEKKYKEIYKEDV